MATQQPIHVVVEKKGGCFSGCGTAIGVMLLIGLAVEYWYVSLIVVVLIAVVALVNRSQARSKVQDAVRLRPGPRDPWLNEVVVALADLGFTEIARNTGSQLAGAQLDGDIGLEADGLTVYVNLFSDQRTARQAELGLKAKPDVRAAMSTGATAITTVDRIVYVANGRGGVVDEFRVDEVVRVVGRLSVPPALRPGPVPATPDPDALEQLRKLGDLRKAGVLTDAEFEAKKAELLGRI